MSKVILDEALRQKLKNFAEYLEVCDESGRTLGYVIPAAAQDPALYAGVQSPLSEEELDRREQEPGGRTLAEIWARLGVS